MFYSNYFICFKNIDLSFLHLRHFDFSKFTLFLIVLELMSLLPIYFLQLTQQVCFIFCFGEIVIFLIFWLVIFIMWQYFLTIHFKHFVFIEWFDLNSNLKSLFQRSSINEILSNVLVKFLVDSLMWFCILPIQTKISKFSA